MPAMEGPELEHMPELSVVFDWRGAWLWLVIHVFVERAADVPGASLQVAPLQRFQEEPQLLGDGG